MATRVFADHALARGYFTDFRDLGDSDILAAANQRAMLMKQYGRLSEGRAFWATQFNTRLGSPEFKLLSDGCRILYSNCFVDTLSGTLGFLVDASDRLQKDNRINKQACKYASKLAVWLMLLICRHERDMAILIETNNDYLEELHQNLVWNWRVLLDFPDLLNVICGHRLLARIFLWEESIKWINEVLDNGYTPTDWSPRTFAFFNRPLPVAVVALPPDPTVEQLIAETQKNLLL